MTKKTNLKDEILNSVDGKIIKDNCSAIKASYYALQENKNVKHSKVNWGILGTSMGVLAAAAVIVPFALKGANNGNNENTSVIDLVPETVNAQVPDISFGVASLSGVLSDTVGKQNNVTKSIKRFGPGPGGPGYDDPHHHDEDEKDYLLPVNEMYKLVKPYLSTVDDMLNGGDFVYQIEESGNETYPYKLGNFMFNIVENKEEEGEVDDEEDADIDESEEEVPEVNDPEEGPIEEQQEEKHIFRKHGHKDEEIPVEEPIEEPVEEPTEEEPIEEPVEEEPDEPDFTFISEFYDIEGIIVVDEVEFPVTGEQITFGCSDSFSSRQYSELYLNVALDEETELTVYKSTYSDSFTNTFRDTVVDYDYIEESYAYITNKLETVTDHWGKERIKKTVVNSVEINTAKENVSYNDESRENAQVYLSIDSSYIDDDEVENTITADLSFRLPREEGGKYKVKEVEEIIDGDPIEEPIEEPVEEPIEEPVEEPIEEPTEEEPEVITTKALRVDYDCKVISNTPYENEEQYGHGQHHDDWMHREGPGRKYESYTAVFGSFYVYKDADGNLIDPDFENEGRHDVIGNGGYNHDWFDEWMW